MASEQNTNKLFIDFYEINDENSLFNNAVWLNCLLSESKLTSNLMFKKSCLDPLAQNFLLFGKSLR